jgi:hypothetical protein
MSFPESRLADGIGIPVMAGVWTIAVRADGAASMVWAATLPGNGPAGGFFRDGRPSLVGREDNDMPGTYLVIGGTGRVGHRVADLLAPDGHEIIAACRCPHAARGWAVAVDLSRDLDAALLDGVDGIVVPVEPPMDTPGAEALLHHGVARLAGQTTVSGTPVVLISQIYVARAGEHPKMAGIVRHGPPKSRRFGIAARHTPSSGQAG